MNIKITLLLFVFALCMGANPAKAQVTDPSSVDVNSMSDSQVKQVKQAMEQRGLSQQDAIELARQRGATESQIQNMMRRFQELDSISGSDVYSYRDIADSISAFQKFDDRFIQQAPIDTVTPTFGARLFNTQNLTFEPSLNIQTPKNYTIGYGDQLIISIWGSSQGNYQLAVNKDGQIMVPDLGPIFILGLTFDKATNKIKERLSSIYVDMRGDHPKTFAQINMGQLRSIKINVVGEITTPGTYTLPVTATVFNALYLSGGPNDKGSFRNIKIIRNNKPVKEVDVYKYLVDADPTDNIQLENEDIIYVPTFTKKVEVIDGFKRACLFEMKKDEHLNDLIRFAGGFKDDASMSRLQINRKTQQGLKIVDVDFKSVNIARLENGDVLRAGKIRSSYNNRLTISGAVYSPGEYEWTDGLMLSQLIARADSIVPGAFLNRGRVIRLNPDSTTYNIPFSVKKVIAGKEDIALQPEDSIRIKSYNELKETEVITVRGEVLEPGTYPFSQNMTLEDVIFVAGGLKESSDTTFIEVARRLSHEEAADLSDTLMHLYTFSVNRKLEVKNGDPDFTLQPFDVVFFRRAPGYRESGSVLIKGEVKFEGSFALETNTFRISDLIKKTGGVTPQAYVEGASLTRYSEEMRSETVGIDLKEILKHPGSTADLILLPGDQVTIPKESQTVKIVGNVQNQISATYVPGKKLNYYIDQTGGFKERTRKTKIHVIYANGISASTHSSFFGKNYPKIEPGCKIVVPEKPEKKEGDSAKWISLGSGLSSMAVAVATLITVIK